MNLVEQKVSDRITELLDRVAEISVTLINKSEDKKASTKVADFTTVGEMPPEALRELASIQFQLVLLKGIL